MDGLYIVSDSLYSHGVVKAVMEKNSEICSGEKDYPLMSLLQSMTLLLPTCI